jgi:hypothetical protein
MTKDLKVATWNVRGITHKLDELNRELRNRKIDIAVISDFIMMWYLIKLRDNFTSCDNFSA